MIYPAVPTGRKRCGACAWILNDQGVCINCHPELAALKAPPPRPGRACPRCGRPVHKGHCKGHRHNADPRAAREGAVAWHAGRIAARAATRAEAADARPVRFRDSAPCRAGGDAPPGARKRGPWMGAGEWLGAE